MAYRDKSQGFAFVYVDVKKLLKDARNRAKLSEEAKAAESKKLESTPMPEPKESGKGQVINFHKDRRTQLPRGFSRLNPQTPVEPNPSKTIKHRRETVEQIKGNLDRLQSLHHKLHAVLADIEKRTDKKKK